MSLLRMRYNTRNNRCDHVGKSQLIANCQSVFIMLFLNVLGNTAFLNRTARIDN